MDLGEYDEPEAEEALVRMALADDQDDELADAAGESLWPNKALDDIRTPILMSELRKKVTAWFEKHRATPGASYDESHFLDFLLAAPRVERAVYNSFKGLRRSNAFIDEVQYESAVFFSPPVQRSTRSWWEISSCCFRSYYSTRARWSSGSCSASPAASTFGATRAMCGIGSI
jgi:hypothetical protein